MRYDRRGSARSTSERKMHILLIPALFDMLLRSVLLLHIPVFFRLQSEVLVLVLQALSSTMCSRKPELASAFFPPFFESVILFLKCLKRQTSQVWVGGSKCMVQEMEGRYGASCYQVVAFMFSDSTDTGRGHESYGPTPKCMEKHNSQNAKKIDRHIRTNIFAEPTISAS